MSGSSLAKRYARALIKAVAGEEEFKVIKAEVSVFNRLLEENPDFRWGMESPLLSRDQKIELLETIREKSGLNNKSYNFLKTLIEENRLKIMDSIIEQLDQQWLDRLGVLRLHVSSAVTLNDQLKKKLKNQLEKSYAKKVHLEFATDKSLIAGIKISHGSVSYDLSIAGNLKRLREMLIESSISGTAAKADSTTPSPV